MKRLYDPPKPRKKKLVPTVVPTALTLAPVPATTPTAMNPAALAPTLTAALPLGQPLGITASQLQGLETNNKEVVVEQHDQQSQQSVSEMSNRSQSQQSTTKVKQMTMLLPWQIQLNGDRNQGYVLSQEIAVCLSLLMHHIFRLGWRCCTWAYLGL